MSLLPPRTKKSEIAVADDAADVLPSVSASVAPVEPSLNDILKLVAQALQQGAANSSAQLEGLQTLLKTQQEREQAKDDREDLTTKEARKAGRHVGATGAYENNFPPEISAMNPLGERDNPRPELKCEMIWIGFRITKESQTREEIELLNKIAPGAYTVTKSDGKRIPFTVQAKTGVDGRLERMTFHFPCKNTEDRHNHAPMVSYLREALGETHPSVDLLLTQIETLKAELVAKGA